MTQRLKKVGTKWGTSENGKTYLKPVLVDHNGDLSKQWHVYYKYWDDDKQRLIKARKSSIPGHLSPNRSQDPKVRYEELSILRDVLERLLKLDWVPNKKFPITKLQDKLPTKVPEEVSVNIIDAIGQALELKKSEASPKYFKMLSWRMENFKEFLINNNLDHLIADKLSRKHILAYLKYVQESRGLNGQIASNKTRNGYLGDLSSIFNTMVAHELILINPCTKIKKLQEKTGRHVPYSSEDIILFSKWSKEHSPYLYKYTQLIAYAFLRPKEILDLQLKDIDLQNRVIKLRRESAKVDAVTIPIIEPLFITLSEMFTENTPKHYYLFTLDEKPGPKRIAQTRYFSRRFNRWKEEMTEKNNRSFTQDHTLYGIRHTFIQNIFQELRKMMTKNEAEFKLMTITRHRTIDALRKYTRDYSMELAEDWSNKFTLRF
ncbi:site-specific recombinase XerD [Owenweeksia hongkongensis DSM 17368]|uniref:Site-specific recombinase XerD n=1 Tax=Owenweeksia hongkongensis (strain DSM 17368 / CIP 108786 / JCM 12287 / NRRL B-23963 / UST20020801) TaxID=926562 RepID=G8R533_OWEHD|nr:site-specific integrase [Owenweeksia hongkongensis]AEV31044.1 site-specific recombinase XerD [Owenweeksia hongkongensis DSM 17368]